MHKRLFLLYFPGYFDGDEIIGIYDEITDLKAAYERVFEDLEHKYEILLESPYTELTIAEFDRDSEKFEVISPDGLWKELDGLDKYKKIKYRIDDAWQYMFWREYVSEQNGRLICDGNYSRTSDSMKEEMDIYFKVDDTAEIMEMMDFNWSGWNECPTSDIMAAKMCPNALDIADFETIKRRLIEEGAFVLWWD